MTAIDILKKDIKTLLTDKKALAIIMLMPIVLTSILSLALQGMFEGEIGSVGPINVAIVKEYNIENDMQAFSTNIVNRYMKNENNEVKFNDLDIEKIFFD